MNSCLLRMQEKHDFEILAGLVLGLTGICLNTQLTVKVNMLWCVNFGVVKLSSYVGLHDKILF